ncbi:hypothetical protein [Paenibacillus sacheonensis]|uniref:Uncharacterized protein n=1 Tax=Paenibacillus sacheonensis TaxID=742054 RepID=A0A7X4YPN3_9BACL|nr:hypothetical protein [Paenibacillus sacheonensis]MBM7565053.1 hypothetical protein [Paenibacillus sacheonensis]NBC70163.1 hypothetical protein [Paenibacillus sacheonensis]
MKNALFMTVEASHSLNFLVYLQNSFLNKHHTDAGEVKFPYTGWNNEFLSYSAFAAAFKELWNDVIDKIAANPVHDLHLFHQHEAGFHEKLFQPGNAGRLAYDELHKSFQVWWGSFAGSFALEGSISNDDHHDVYSRLAEYLAATNTEPSRTLKISLVYDAFPLGGLEVMPFYAVATVREFRLRRDREALVARLRTSVEGG